VVRCPLERGEEDSLGTRRVRYSETVPESRLFAVLSGLAAGAAGILLVAALGVLWRCGGSLHRALWLGRPLMQIQALERGAIVPQEGLLLRVSFSEPSLVATETFRCELNGVDVTARMLNLDATGVSGPLHPLHEGVNTLRVGVFGSGWLGGWVEDVIELEVRARTMLYWDRA